MRRFSAAPNGLMPGSTMLFENGILSLVFLYYYPPFARELSSLRSSIYLRCVVGATGAASN